MKTLISIGSIAVSSIALNLIPVQPTQAADLSFTTSPPTGTVALYAGVGGGPTVASTTFGNNWTSQGYNFLVPNGTAISTPNGAAFEGLTDGNGAAYSMDFYGTSLSAPVGDAFVAADGAYLTGRIYQDLTDLEIGQMYSISFYQAAAQQNGQAGATTNEWIVNVGGDYTAPTYISASGDTYGGNLTTGGFTGGTTHTSPTMSLVSQGNAGTQTVTSGSAQANGWQQDSFAFTATATTQRLSFLAHGTPAGKPPFALLAAVSANKIPEPDTYVGTLLGLGIVGTIVKFRLAKKKLDN